MAGEYDGISVVGKTPTSGDYDAIDITGASRLRANVGTVFDVNPDEVARKRRLAEYLGYRPAAGTILPDADVRREAAVKTVEQNVQGAPALRQQYTDEEFAALGHDNSFNLSQIEKGIQALLYPTPKNNFRAELKSLPGALASGAPAMGAGMYGLAAFGAGSLGATGAESFMLDQAQQSADVAKRWQGVFGQSKNNDVRAVGSGLQSAGQALMLSPLAIFGGPAGVRAMLGIMAATQGGQTYTEDRTFDFNKAVPQRQSVFTAGVHGIADATAEYMGERYFGAGGFFERVAAGATAGKLLIYEIAKELPGEIATTLVQNFNKWVLTEPDKSVKDFLLEQPDAIRQTAIATVVGGGTQIGVVKTAEAVIGRHIEHQARANAAAQNAEVIKHIMGLAEADVLRERSPETFAQFMQAAAEHGPISDVYIDVHTLAETLGNKIEDVKALVPSIGAQFDQAMAEGPGSQIRIPVSEFATNLAGEAYAQPLIEHLRAGEDAMSAAEAKVYVKEQGDRIKEEIAKVMEEKQNDGAFKASRDAVQAETLAKLNAAGRYTAAVNEKLATLHANVYSVFAAKLGMMPEQFAKEYEVQVKHEEGAATYNKEALLKPGELTVEGYHFSKEQRSTLTTRMFGTGLKGSNQEVFKNATDKRLRNRLYFYVDKGTGINPEAGVGAYGHKAKLSNIYDANSDPLRLRKGGQEAFESAVLDRGFAGYLDRLDGTQSGHVVLLGDQSITPEALGPLSKTTGEVVPPPAARASEGRDKIVDALQANKNLPMGAPPISMWRNLLKGEIADALEKAGVFDGDQSRTMYKSELIRAFEKATEDPNALKPAHGAGVFFRAKDTGRILLVKRADNVSQPRTWNLVSGAIEKGETPEQAAMREAKEEIGYTGGGNPRFVGQTSHEGVVFNSYVVDVPNEFVPTLNEENTGHGWYDPGALPDDLHPGVSRLMDAQEKALGQDYDQAARIKTGPELFTDVINKLGLTPQEVAATALEFMTGLPGDMAFFTPHGTHDMGVPEVVQFLDARRKASGLPVLDISKPEDRAQLARLVAAEALAAIKSAGASLEWYDQTIRSMLDTVALQHPELKSDPHARNVFLIATAITSQGLNPVGNLKFARTQYEEFTKTGKFPEVGQGDSGEAMAKNFVKANKLMAAFTPKELADFLVTEFTVKELSTIGFEVSGESMGTKVLGSAVFGPKIGFGFYSNLNGNFEPVTMDMWFMRTFGRLAGTLPDFDPKRYAGQLARFREGLRERGNKRGLYARDFDPEMVAKALVDDDAALALARVVNSAHQKDFRDNRAKFDRGTREKSTIVAASATMIQSMDKPKDVPSTGTERNHMRDVVTQVVDLVQQHYGTRVPPAALQALIWYPEQELYSELGVKLPVTSTDYADAARGLMKEAGFSDADIDAAAGIRATTQPGPTGVRPSSGQGNASANGQAGRGISGAVPLQGEQRTAAIAKHQAERTFFQSSNAGHTVNIGLDIPGGGTLSVDEVLAALTAAGVKVGQHAVHKSNTEQTVVASLDRALTPEEAHALSVALKQEAIAQMSNGQGELYGPQAENWRPFNPEYFLRMDGSRANTAAIAKHQAERTFFQSGASTEPLAGAPSVPGYHGPDPAVVAVAEQYARDNGIPLQRQAAYAKVDPALARRIAQAYADMKHDPQDPQVKAAYAALLAQTRAQYDALVAAGYRFTFFDSKTDPYQGNPWNAMRDLRSTKTMAVYGTYDGYGTEGITQGVTENNPLLADMGLQWPDQAGVMHPVTGNDLFRAVHDAFGHGLEGAGFRAQGEENAWQAHRRLFTGAAVGAMTSETRGQNSWLNFGPYAEANEKAKVYDTVFADQKIGLMPEWTWTEGVVPDASDETSTHEQPKRGSITFGTDITKQASVIRLLEDSDLSTYLHESGHLYLEIMSNLAGRIEAKIAAGDHATPGEQSIVDDMRTVLDWMGVKATPELTAIERWVLMPLEEKTAHHEMWARGFELYAFEGKSPSLALRDIFRTFRAWLAQVYRSLTDTSTAQTLRVNLSPEVRQVMDRMVATTEDIQEAEAARDMGPLFKTAEEAGMSPEEWHAYHDLGVNATQSAIEDLQARSLRDMQWASRARSRKLKELQALHDDLRKATELEVTADVMSQPVYRAWAFLTSTVDPVLPGVEEVGNIEPEARSAKLRTSFVKEISETIWKVLSDRHMTSDVTGVDPDQIAPLFGFDSGDMLVHNLANAEDPKTVIEGITDRLMLERHGELATPQAMAQAADEAVHDDARARFVATELAALEAASRVREKVPGKPRATVDVLAKAAREYARDVIARLKVRDIKPGQYAAAAERSAAAAMKTRKDLAKAAEHKRNQLINTAAAKAANDALAEMKKAMAYFKSVQKAGVLPASYHEQIMALLDKFDLRVSRSNKAIDNTAKFRTWAKAQLDEGNVPPNFELLLSKQQRAAFEREILQRNADGELIYGTDEEQAVLLASYLDEAPVRNIKDATVEEIRGLRDTIKQIEHMGKRTKKVLTDRKNREFAEVVKSIKDRIVEVGERTGRKAGDTRTPNDTKGQEKLSWRGFFFSHIKAANITHVMDGGDGGPLWEHLIETANEAANNEAVDISKSHDAIQAMLAPLKEQGDITGKATYFPGLKRSLNRQAILVMALNLGNASNEQRLLGGEGWTREQIEPALATLTKADWTFVQKMWDHFESFRPRVGAMEREINGVEPEWIDARPLEVTTKDGEKLSLRGGYAPVVFDPRASGKAASQAAEKDAKALLQAARVANSVNKSFTKSRVQEVKGRPLKLSLDAMINAVQDTIHYLHWQPWVIDANRLVRAVDEPVRQYYGAEVTHLLRDWVADNAAGMRPARDAAERKVTALARNVSFAGLAFNFMSAAMQVTGYSQSVAVIGGKWMGRGMARMIAAPREAHAQAVEKSSFMAKRTTTRMRDMAEVNNSVQGQTALRGWTDRAGYGMMMAMQTMVDTPTWWGAYEKAIDAGRDEHDAVALADQAVKDSQGSGLHTDLASIERAQGAVRLLTGFMSFMNTTMNVNYRVLKSEQSTPAKIMDLLLVNVVPVILTIALKAALTPGDSGDDDAKKIAKKFGTEMFNFMMGQMVGTRELAQLAAAFAGEPSGDYGGPVGLRWVADSIKLAKQVGQGQMDDAFRKALVNAASDVLRLPGAQMNRTITGYEALKDGKTKNPAALVMGYQEPH